MARPRKNGTAMQEMQTTETTEQLYPVRLNKNYRPKTVNFEVLDFEDEDIRELVRLGELARKDAERQGHPMSYRQPDGTPEKYDEHGSVNVVAGGDLAKVWKGTTIKLPKAEAIEVIQKRIGDRADEFARD